MARPPKAFADPSVVPWARSRCLLLTTYRRDGTPVASPVWFVTDDHEIRLWTGADTGKARRLRRDPHCTIAPCTFSGRATGEALPGEARALPAADGARVQALLRAKYPVQKRALDLYGRLHTGGQPGSSTYLAVSVSS